MLQKIEKIFISRFGTRPAVFKSPGRVNILGEHTDYNEGFVLPASIDKAVYLAVAKRSDDLISLYAEEFNEAFSCRLNEIKPRKNSWTNYILGVVDQLQKFGFTLSGFDLAIDGDIPLGAGLASSAAVECATVFALNEMFSLKLEKLQLVQIAQKAEQTYAGVSCGIMDQFASVFGNADHLIKLDCRSLEYQYVPLHLEGISILLLNTNVKHNLASSEYNVRRMQCEEGVERISRFYPEVNSLRDVTLEMLNSCIKPNEIVYKRCKYVIEENSRLILACEDLKNGDIVSLGTKMFLTHRGLQKDFEVSCSELDFLVEASKNNSAVLGARMMGGGFGGCTINLVKKHAIDELVDDLSKRYERETGLGLTSYVARTESGTAKIFNLSDN